MKKCTVIGSGPSGVHFALTALELGMKVDMIDVGRDAPTAVNPHDTFLDLKTNLQDPTSYLLGNNNEGILLPGQQEEFYGIPPSKNYATESVPQHKMRNENFEPMSSFAKGGLAQMWTAGCYPFNEKEFASFPIEYNDIYSCYETVAKRIGINGMQDDLSTVVPYHDNIQMPLTLDKHSALLLQRYKKQKTMFQKNHRCVLGHARHAVLSQNLGNRKSCKRLGRCLWGCPVDAIYTPSITLKECMQYPGFTYHGNRYVTHFAANDAGQIQTVTAESTNGDDTMVFDVETLVLAGGALGSSKIFLESVYRITGEIINLKGLMDNRQVLVPFLNLKMIGKKYQPDSYQYNQLAMELENDVAEENVHCLITTLKTAMIHPVIEKFPFDLRTSIKLFKNIHTALGVLNINFHDTRRDDCYVSLEVDSDNHAHALVTHYTPTQDEDIRIKKMLKRVKKILWKLGCIVPPGMVYTRPMGASVHYAGTIPMSKTKQPWSVSPDCRSYDFNNLYIVDGATYPFLPAKNITFTLMANAIRVARIVAK